jgi:hypothetical protein
MCRRGRTRSQALLREVGEEIELVVFKVAGCVRLQAILLGPAALALFQNS